MKTNFLKTVKHSMFLLLAILGTIAGYSQQTQNPATSTIGGSKTPGDIGGLINPSDTGGRTPGGIGLINYNVNDYFDIGGRDSTGGLGSTSNIEIGGRGSSDTGTGQYEIWGGKSTDGGLIINPLATTGEIGGGSTGGGKGTSGDTGQIAFSELEYSFKSFSKDLQDCIKKPAPETLLFQF